MCTKSPFSIGDHGHFAKPKRHFSYLVATASGCRDSTLSRRFASSAAEASSVCDRNACSSISAAARSPTPASALAFSKVMPAKVRGASSSSALCTSLKVDLQAPSPKFARAASCSSECLKCYSSADWSTRPKGLAFFAVLLNQVCL